MGSVLQVDCAPSQFEVLILGTLNMNLFGDRVFPEVIRVV
jgi:hypothetical protein